MANRFLNNIKINDSYTLPTADGAENQIIVTDGAGNLSFNDLNTVTESITGVQSNFTYYEVKNSSGAAIGEFKAVRAVGTDGNSGHILIDEMVADGSVEARYFLGITMDGGIANGGIGRVVAFGEIDQINTSGFTDGDVLWCDPASDGNFTTTEPSGPNLKIPAAIVLNSATNGKIQVRVQANEGLHQLHDVNISSQADNDLLQWNSTAGVWENKTLAGAGVQPAGTYNTIIGTDTDISYSGATVLSTMTMTDGVIQSHSSRTLTAGDIGAAASSHTHDDRYYTESEIQTYFNRGYISSQSATNLAVGWYTIATNTGDRALGEFQIWETAGSRHQSVLFNASHHFGVDDSNDITVLANSRFGTDVFRYIRIKEGGTYDGAALQIYIDNATNTVNVAITGANAQTNGWVLKDWVADATDPGDLSNYSSFTEACRIDLDNIQGGGIATTGGIFSGGATTQYRNLTTADEGSGNGLDADTLDGQHGSYYATASHNHDSTYVNVTGDTMTGDLTLNYLYPRINLYDSNNDSDYSIINNNGSFSIYDITNNSHRLHISSSGNVGIGTTSPSAKLEVRQDANNGNTGAFTNTHVKLTASATADNTGFVGITAATSTSDNYGYSFGAQRTSGGVGSFKINYHNNSAAGTNRFIIDQNGNVGIGTTTPGQKLDVSGNVRATNYYCNGGYFIFGTSSAEGEYIYRTGNDVRIYAGGSSILTVDGDSNRVGINTTAPSYSLDVNGTFRVTSTATFSGTTGLTTTYLGPNTYMGGGQDKLWFGGDYDDIYMMPTGLSYGELEFYDSSGTRFMHISPDGLGIGNVSPSYSLELEYDSAAKPSSIYWDTVSDERVKTNIQNTTKGLDEINQLRVVTYDYNGKGGFSGTDQIGLIAQEVSNIFPEAVGSSQRKLEPTDEELTEIYNLKFQPISMALIKAVQELSAKVETLEARIQTLEAQ
jgi:hypothetical protein